MALLSTSIAGIELVHPVMNASGILGDSVEALSRLVDAGVSALVTKSFTREPREGYPTPIAVPVPCGLLNAVGLANPGIEALPGVVKGARELGLPVITSIAGGDEEEFIELASTAEEAGASAIELNLSCPHSEARGLELGVDYDYASRIVGAVSSTIRIPVFAKLGYVDRPLELAGKLLDSGVSGFVLINTLRGMAIDVYSAKPILGYRVGGLSGRAIHPVAVRIVYEVYREYRVDIIGVGGVEDWETAVEFILAGARAVQVGTAIILKGERVIREITNGIEKYLEENNYTRLDDIIGLACRD